MKFIIEDLCYRVKIKKVIDFIISSVTLCLTKRLSCNCNFVFWNCYFISHNSNFMSCSLTLYLTMWLYLTKRLYTVYHNCNFDFHNCNFVSHNCDLISCTLTISLKVILYITIATLFFLFATSYLAVETLFLAMWLYLVVWLYVSKQLYMPHLQFCFL